MHVTDALGKKVPLNACADVGPDGTNEIDIEFAKWQVLVHSMGLTLSG